MSDFMSFISSGWGTFAAVAAGVGLIVAFWKNIKVIGRRIHQRHLDIEEAKKFPADVMEEIKKIREEQERRDEERKEDMRQIMGSIDEIKEQVKSLDSQTCSLINEKLTWAYMHYGVRRNAISYNELTSLERMYKIYTENGMHNHIPEDFIAKIQSAPVEAN